MVDLLKSVLKHSVLTFSGTVLGALMPVAVGAALGCGQGVRYGIMYGEPSWPLVGAFLGSMMMLSDGGDWWILAATVGGLACLVGSVWLAHIRQFGVSKSVILLTVSALAYGHSHGVGAD